MHPILRVLLVLTALANLAWGLFALGLPDRAAELLGFTLNSPEARGEVRATYGGLILGLGLVQLLALRGPRGQAWLAALALVFAALGLGRLSSLALDGLSTYTAGLGAVEIGLALLLAMGSRSMDPETNRSRGDSEA
ncbi:DUF4345 family protein [Engelhardtia mirabilis]|uniref:DUF4345 domain-containing protein n=1 Tax=Engelhardtia mirabilis TaxID=2528011 RepID=A0A518BLF9_9BACT|nr:hypothetical protein Pla133_28980 [Planctomycetes bacterium Pla133]QDV02135.1 hypothetical protein Pla86_28970 [Planctomycetes bacterium Pla86]